MLKFTAFRVPERALLVVGLPLLACGCAGVHREAPERSWAVAREVGPARTELSRTPAFDASRPRPTRDSVGVTHVVEPGQTIWRIASSYELSVEDLARANDIADPARIDAGREIRIPGARQAVDVPVHPATASKARHSLGSAAGLPERGEWTWPVRDGRILSYFGAPRKTHRHTGLDIFGPRGGAVFAARSGIVVYSDEGMRGYGKTVILDHGNGVTTLYAHNSELLVRKGQHVRPGERIARLGRTGNASTEHCHFEIRRYETPLDPLQFLIPEVEARR